MASCISTYTYNTGFLLAGLIYIYSRNIIMNNSNQSLRTLSTEEVSLIAGGSSITGIIWPPIDPIFIQIHKDATSD
jgi:hypothetical protein